MHSQNQVRLCGFTCLMTQASTRLWILGVEAPHSSSAPLKPLQTDSMRGCRSWELKLWRFEIRPFRLVSIWGCKCRTAASYLHVVDCCDSIKGESLWFLIGKTAARPFRGPAVGCRQELWANSNIYLVLCGFVVHATSSWTNHNTVCVRFRWKDTCKSKPKRCWFNLIQFRSVFPLCFTCSKKNSHFYRLGPITQLQKHINCLNWWIKSLNLNLNQ